MVISAVRDRVGPALPRRFAITNANLVSMDDARPQQLADATIIIADGRIDSILPRTESHGVAFTINVDGRTVIPGLTDGHAHADRESLGDDLPGFIGAQGVDDVLEVIRDAVVQAQPGEWIVTRPLGTPPRYRDADDPFGGGRLPTRHDLDRVSPDNPVFIRSIWGYWNVPAQKISFANSLALGLAGITRDTTSPHEALTIEHDTAGEPTGVFRESNREPLIEHTLMRVAPGFSLEQRSMALNESFRRSAAVGTTAIYEGHGVADEVLEAYLRVYGVARGARLRALLPTSPHSADTGSAIHSARAWARRFEVEAGGWARVEGLFSETYPDLSGARLRAANHPRTGWAGFSSGATLSRGDMVERLVRCARHGIRVCTIGNQQLDVFEEVNRIVPIAGLDWVLGHVAYLTPEQLESVVRMGLLVTTVTGHHVYRGGFAAHLVGSDREDEIVPIRSLLEAGVTVVLGTDNRPVSLWDSFWHAVARRNSSGELAGPGQAVTRYEALKLITVNGAILTGDAARRGVLRSGALADLVVLDRNPLECALDDVRETRSALTMIGGQIAHDDGTLWRTSSSGHKMYAE